MTDPSKPADDDPRDVHLLAALRHAPDRDIAPPAQVTAEILAQAQAAVRGPRARRAVAPAGWRAAWARLWQPVPMAAFGTIAMATVIGVLWGGRDVPEAAPNWRPEGVATAPARAPTEPTSTTKPTFAPAPEPGPAPVLAAAPVPATERAPVPANQTAANAAPAAALPADKRSAAEAKSADRAEDESGRARAQQKEKLRQSMPDAEGGRDAVAAGKLDEPVATPPRLAQKAAPPPPAAPPAQSPPAAMAQERAAAPETRRDVLSKSMADAAAAPSRARSEQAALGAAASAMLSPLAQAGAELDAGLGRDAARVRWRTAAGRLVAHESAQRDAWAALKRATEGRWQRVDAGASRAGGAMVVLMIAGAPRGSLAFEPKALVWRDAGATTWRAPLDAETLRELEEAFEGW